MTQISLQATRGRDPEKGSLASFIARVAEQRGAFRNVTEQSLKEEIRKGEEDAIDVDNEEDESDENEEDENTRVQQLSKAREEMCRHVFLAKDQSQMALDLVSHLASQKYPGPAVMTMSPLLKQSVPTGTLGLDLNQQQQPDEATRYQNDLVALGWRMQYLNIAADAMASSASKLEREVERETSYWNQVLAIKDQGWSLSRLPREKHTIGVHFGFREAHPSFRGRGFAPLRLDPTNQLYLDRDSSRNKRLQLRMLYRGNPVATFHSLHSDNATNDNAVLRDIVEARDSLFDEELFFELNREAQILANREVQCVKDLVLMPCSKDRQVEISLQENSELAHQGDSNSDPEHTKTLRILLLTFRLLLSRAHRQTLWTRSRPPPPIREEPTPRPTYQIILPVLEHREQTASMKDLLLALKEKLN